MKEITILQKAGVFVLGCLGLLALTGVWFIYKTLDQQDTKTFVVQGKGEVEVKATKATISGDFVAETKNSTSAAEATAELTKITTKVFAELEKIGVKTDQIKTQNFSTNPKYEYCYHYLNNPRLIVPQHCKVNPSEGKIVGYTATQNFTITIEDNKELVEKVLGLLPSLGARNTYGPNWEVDNKKAIQQARELAVAEAKEKAEGIAKAVGKKLGDVVFYSENQGGGERPVLFDRAVAVTAKVAAPEYAPIPVSEGTDKVTVLVDITYELE